MPDRLPPLTALRAFEAAARHLSFAKAADELSVTASALSFQIKSLETHLGQPVFRRLNRAVELTEAGRVLAPGLTEGFGALTRAWQVARQIGDTQTLTVTAGPAFTAKWLAPRLFDFAQAHPEVDLRFVATLRLLEPVRDTVDVAIRFGERAPSGMYCRTILDDWVTPMMAPSVAERISAAADLRQTTLLHQDDLAFLRHPVDWPAWFRAAGLGSAPTAGPRFSQADHALDAALAGGGAVLGRVSLASRDLESGRLVAPFALSIRIDAKYRFLCSAGAETRPQVAAFLDWITAETTPSSSLDPGRVFVDAAEIASP